MAKNKQQNKTQKKRKRSQAELGQVLTPKQADAVWALLKRAYQGDHEALHEGRMLLCEYSPWWVFHHDRLREQQGQENKQAKNIHKN